MYPIFVRIAAKKEKAYIKTVYEISDLSQWYNGKVVARPDATMMNKRLLFELKKYSNRVNEIENNDTYTATQLKLIIVQSDKVTQCCKETSVWYPFFRLVFSFLLSTFQVCNDHRQILLPALC